MSMRAYFQCVLFREHLAECNVPFSSGNVQAYYQALLRCSSPVADNLTAKEYALMIRQETPKKRLAEPAGSAPTTKEREARVKHDHYY